MSDTLESKLEQLEHGAKVIFVLLCAERQIRCLRDLEDKDGPIYDAVLAAIDAAFSMVAGEKEFNVNLIHNYISRFLMCTPSDELSSNAAVIQKIHALNSVIYALEVLLADDVENAAYVARLAQESINIKVRTMTDSEGDAKNHSLSKKETLKQKVDLEVLKQRNNYDWDFINELRKNNQSCSIDPV